MSPTSSEPDGHAPVPHPHPHPDHASVGGQSTRESRAVYRSRSEHAARAERERQSRSFSRAFWWLVGTLIVACGVFLGIAVLQGPKLTDVQFDTSAAIARADQSARLFFNQPVVALDADQVSVSPSAGVTVATEGDLVTVQFGSPLLYGTEYTITMTDVRSQSLPTPATVEYRFTTPTPSPFVLDRADPAVGGSDAIVRVGLTGSAREVVYEAPGIESFAVTGQVLAVSSRSAEGTSRLQLVSLHDGAVEDIRLPAPGQITGLAAADTGAVLGFTFTPQVRGDDALGGREVLLLDLEKGRALTPVGDLGGSPLPVTDWVFIPGSSSLLAQGLEQTTYVVGSAPGSEPTPLGRFSEIVSVAQDGRTFLARDALGAVSVSLTDGTQVRIEPSLIQGGMPFVGQAEVLPSGDIIEKAALQTTDGRFVVIVAVDDGTEGRVLYQTPNLAGSIENFHVSPNGQYVAIEVVPVIADSISDGYAVDPRSTSITTVIVDIATGLEVRSVDGFGLLW